MNHLSKDDINQLLNTLHEQNAQQDRDGIKATIDEYRARLHAQNTQKDKEAFDALDPTAIAVMADKELATFQTEHEPTTGQYVLAQYEWQRRLIVRQVKAAYRVGLIGAIAAVISAFAGVALGWWLSQLSEPKQGNPPGKSQTSIQLDKR
jgi:hypothetical protein